jgi:ParB family chromosome partitioning protein
MLIPIDKITRNPEQMRKNFDQSALNELAQSIKDHGLLQPILVQESEDGYILIAGERRLRAHQILGLAEIEAVVRPSVNGSSSKERTVLALVENLQRAGLAPMEEARGYKALRDMGLSVAAIARQCGIAAATIVGRLSLLDLDPEIQDLIDADLLPIDPRVSAALKSIPQDIRVEFTRKLARPGLRIKTVQTSVEKLNAALAAERIGSEPSLKIAFRRTGSPDLPNWDALHQIQRLPPWNDVAKAARHTCNTCALRQEASVVVCGDCPAVVMLSKMIDISKKEKASHEPVRRH